MAPALGLAVGGSEKKNGSFYPGYVSFFSRQCKSCGSADML